MLWTSERENRTFSVLFKGKIIQEKKKKSKKQNKTETSNTVKGFLKTTISLFLPSKVKFLLLFLVKPKAGFAIWKQTVISLQQRQLAISGYFKPAMIFLSS